MRKCFCLETQIVAASFFVSSEQSFKLSVLETGCLFLQRSRVCASDIESDQADQKSTVFAVASSGPGPEVQDLETGRAGPAQGAVSPSDPGHQDTCSGASSVGSGFSEVQATPRGDRARRSRQSPRLA